MSSQALDQLCLIRQPLSVRPQLQRIETSVCFQAQDSPRKVHFATPFIVRKPEVAELGEHWAELCQLLKHYGIPIRCGAEAFEALPPASIPLRIAARLCAEPFRLEELQTADLIELDGRSAPGEKTNWYWPTELANPSQLNALVESVRAAAGDNCPVGIVLPVGAAAEDLQAAQAAGADFITLVSDSESVDSVTLWSLVQAHSLCASGEGQGLPIILDAPVASAVDTFKCLALGATVVSIDRILSPHVPRRKPAAGKKAPRNLLSDIAPATVKPARTLNAIEQVLGDTVAQITALYAACGISSSHEFQSTLLRATTADMARICRVAELA